MGLYNVLSCSGFEGEVIEKTTLAFGACAGARLGLVGLFFLNAIVRKWGGEELGIDYNFWMGLGGAFLGYLIMITLTGMAGLSMIIGIIAMLVGGYLGGGIIGGGDEYGYDD